MPVSSGFNPLTPDALRAIARQASSDHFAQGTDLTTAVVKAASLAGMPLTNEHVRRVCEMTYHDVFERSWRDAPGNDKYVSFDPPDAILAAQQLDAVKVASVSSRRFAMQAATATSTKTASAPPRRFDSQAAMGRAVDAAFAPVEHATKVAYANPLGEVQALRNSMKEAVLELEAREYALSSSEKSAAAHLASQTEQACKDGFKVGEVLFACVSPLDMGQDHISEGLVHELASHLVGRGFSVETGSKVASGGQVNPEHPLPRAFEKVASLRKELTKVSSALAQVRAEHKELRGRINALGN